MEYVILAVIAIVVLGVWISWKSASERRYREVEQRAHEEWQERVKKDDALTCNKCGGLAEPIAGSGNRYSCPGCGRQFAGARHRL